MFQRKEPLILLCGFDLRDLVAASVSFLGICLRLLRFLPRNALGHSDPFLASLLLLELGASVREPRTLLSIYKRGSETQVGSTEVTLGSCLESDSWFFPHFCSVYPAALPSGTSNLLLNFRDFNSRSLLTLEDVIRNVIAIKGDTLLTRSSGIKDFQALGVANLSIFCCCCPQIRFAVFALSWPVVALILQCNNGLCWA